MKTGSYIDYKAHLPSADDTNCNVVEAWEDVSKVFVRLEELKVNVCVSICIGGRLPFWQRICKMWGIWCGRGLRETHKLSIDNVFVAEQIETYTYKMEED